MESACTVAKRRCGATLGMARGGLSLTVSAIAATPAISPPAQNARLAVEVSKTPETLASDFARATSADIVSIICPLSALSFGARSSESSSTPLGWFVTITLRCLAGGGPHSARAPPSRTNSIMSAKLADPRHM